MHIAQILFSYIKARRIMLSLCVFVVSCFLIFGSFSAESVFAQTAQSQDQFGVGYGANVGLSTRDVRESIVNIIRIALGILGTLALVIVLYGGFVWMTAGGRPDRVDLARKILINGVIGLLIILAAFSLVQFIFSTLTRSTLGTGIQCTPYTCTRCDYSCNATGDGEDLNIALCRTSTLCGGGFTGGTNMTVAWTSPKSGQTNWPLCGMVQVYFSHPVDPATVTSNTFALTVADATFGNGTSCLQDSQCRSGDCSGGSCLGNSVIGNRVVSGKLIQLIPDNDFISNTRYRVVVEGGQTGLRSNSASGGLLLDKTYDWVFTTGTLQDTKPPQVVAVDPNPGLVDVCLEAPIQAEFSESMDIASLLASGADPNDSSNVNSVFLRQAPLLSVGARWNKSIPNDHTLSARSSEDWLSNSQYYPSLDSDVLKDVCGNFLDGNGDGVASKSAGGDDFDWDFTTGETQQCTPEITSIVPTSGYYGDRITITGNHFSSIQNEVVFNNSVLSDNRCFDADFMPQNACIQSWSQKTIQVDVPSGGGNSNGAVSGNISVEVAGKRSAGVYYDVLSPHINTGPSPARGGRGQYVTLTGANFGTTEAKVFFKSVLNPAQEFEAEATDCVASSWKDTVVTIKVPENTPIPLGFYNIQIEDAAGNRSNLASRTFEVTGDPAGPGLCSITPTCGEVGTSPIDIVGVNMGSTTGTVTFGGVNAVTSSWSDTQIATSVPAGIVEGNNNVVVLAAGNTQVSNALPFSSPCGLGAACDSNPTTAMCEPGACPKGQQCTGAGCTCEVKPGAPSVPKVVSGSEYPTCLQSCLNVDIGARFNQDMDPATITNQFGNIAVRACGATCDAGDLGAEIGYTAVTYDSARREIIISPSSRLNVSQKYRVMLFDSIQSSTGESLGGLNFDSTGTGSGAYDSYSWVFGTKSSECTLSSVSISPVNATSDHQGQEIGYNASAKGYNQQCSSGTQSLNRWDYNWSWSSSDSAVATISSSDTAGDGLVDPVQKATVRAEGSTIIKASADGYSAKGALTASFIKCATTTDCTKNGTACMGSVCDETTKKCSPVITDLSPNSGPKQSFVTIQGCYFGAQQGSGEVTFDSIVAPFPACGGSTWSNNQIIVEVPSVSPGARNVVVTRSGDGASTSPQSYTVTNDCRGVPIPSTGVPGICSLSPSVGAGGDSVTVNGVRFGSTQDTVMYTSLDVSGKTAATIDDWQEKIIQTVVPADVKTGNVVVSVDSCESNAVEFSVGTGGQGDTCSVGTDGAGQCTPNSGLCQSDLWCDPDQNCTCQSPGEPVATYDPVDNEQNVCRNSILTVQFDQLMDYSSVASSTRPGLFLGGKRVANPSADCSDYGYENQKVDGDGVYYVEKSKWKRFVLKIQSFFDRFFGRANAQLVGNCRVPFDLSYTSIANTPKICDSNAPADLQGLPCQYDTHCDTGSCILDPSATGPICDSFDGNGCSIFYLTPKKVLSDELDYVYGVTSYATPDDPDPIFGARSLYGVRATDSTANFLVGGICQLDRLEVTIKPPGRVASSDIFYCANKDDCPGDAADWKNALGVDDGSEIWMDGNQHQWTAQSYSLAVSPRQLINAKYTWKEDIDPDKIFSLSGLSIHNPYITIDNSKKGSAKYVVTADDPSGVSQSLSRTLLAKSVVCEDPWPGATPEIDNTYNFSYWYCKDGGLPDSVVTIPSSSTKICGIYSGSPGAYCASHDRCTPGAECVEGKCNAKSVNADADCPETSCVSYEEECKSDLFEDIFIKPSIIGSSDTIILRVLKNPDHLSSKSWFEKFSGGSGDGLETRLVDGYSGVKVGRSVYVGVANDSNGDDSGGTVWTNMYMLSHTQNPRPETVKIFNQILDNLEFNTNMTDLVNRSRLRRDIQRIGDLSTILSQLEDSKALHGDFPSLASGSYLNGISASRWKLSWLSGSGEFRSAMGGYLPKDPLNTFGSVSPASANCIPSNSPEPTNYCSEKTDSATGNVEVLCCSDSFTPGTGSQCVGSSCVQCPLGYSTDECWSGADNGKFYCPSDSHIYLYKYKVDGPEVYANLEYTAGDWASATGFSWGSYNPCSGNPGSNCSCFDLKMNL